ncbi:MAG: hypothetical protein J6Y24_16825 [Bacteroidales bacterium]|nr:hypothetical protein [Bacteroidales bacterium]
MSKTAKIIILVAVLIVVANVIYLVVWKKLNSEKPNELTDEEKKKVGQQIKTAQQLGIINNIAKK